MLTIRDAQLRALEDARRRQLIEELLDHVTAAFAPIVRQIGAARARLAIEGALERAAAHHISADADVAEFVNLVFVFGDAFPDAPRFHWAQRILAAPVGAEVRLRQVRAHALDILLQRALGDINPT